MVKTKRTGSEGNTRSKYSSWKGTADTVKSAGDLKNQDEVEKEGENKEVKDKVEEEKAKQTQWMDFLSAIDQKSKELELQGLEKKNRTESVIDHTEEDEDLEHSKHRAGGSGWESSDHLKKRKRSPSPQEANNNNQPLSRSTTVDLRNDDMMEQNVGTDGNHEVENLVDDSKEKSEVTTYDTTEVFENKRTRDPDGTLRQGITGEYEESGSNGYQTESYEQPSEDSTDDDEFEVVKKKKKRKRRKTKRKRGQNKRRKLNTSKDLMNITGSRRNRKRGHENGTVSVRGTNTTNSSMPAISSSNSNSNNNQQHQHQVNLPLPLLPITNSNNTSNNNNILSNRNTMNNLLPSNRIFHSHSMLQSQPRQHINTQHNRNININHGSISGRGHILSPQPPRSYYRQQPSRINNNILSNQIRNNQQQPQYMNYNPINNMRFARVAASHLPQQYNWNQAFFQQQQQQQNNQIQRNITSNRSNNVVSNNTNIPSLETDTGAIVLDPPSE